MRTVIIYFMGKELLAEIFRLSVSERIQLVQDIWDSIAALPDSLELEESQKEELRRRLQDYRANPESGIDWNDLKAELGL